MGGKWGDWWLTRSIALGRFRGMVADCGVVAVIPYPSNQRRGEDVLWVDRCFRVHSSEEERRL